MRLLMTADAVGGVWNYAVDLARGLKAYGVDTILAVNGPPPSPDVTSGVEMVATGLELDWLATAPERVTAAGRRLAELAGDLRADVVQLNSPAYAADVRFPAPVVGVQHSCTATWWRAVRGDAPWPADFRWRHDLAHRGLLACDAVVAPTHAFAAAVHAAYALPSPVQVVWNGRSAAPPGSSPTASEPYVFTAGRLWDEGKGMGTLDAAAARLPFPVRAAGALSAPGGEPAAFRHMETLGVLDPTALDAQLRSADAFVAPSLYEPFGLSVLEAAQRGRPLILADIPTFRELWGGAAAFFRPGDAEDLALTLEAVLGDGERRLGMSRSALARAARFTVEAMASGMMDVHRSLELPRS